MTRLEAASAMRQNKSGAGLALLQQGAFHHGFRVARPGSHPIDPLAAAQVGTLSEIG